MIISKENYFVKASEKISFIIYDMIKLGYILKELREEKNYSQEEIGKLIGASQTSIKNWELGINEPKASYIIKLAQIFNVTTDYLLGITEDYSVNTISSSDLSDDQQYIVNEYNKLSSTDKQKIVNYMAVCTTRAEKKSDNSLTPMEEELITMTRKLEDKNQLAQILGFLEELLEDSNNHKKDTNPSNNHRNIG